MKLAPYNANNTKGETVYAIGNSQLTKRKIAVAAVYLPPQLRNAEVEEILKDIVENIDKIKSKHEDPIIFIGGDFNKKNLLIHLLLLCQNLCRLELEQHAEGQR